ncbi:MAG: hypothetical protein CMF74_07785 [Maricaulis sp.]|jgi:hypothetical protein|nr:hypothetical protein [Maricaulis sp.]
MTDSNARFSARTALTYFFTTLEKHPGLIWLGVIEVVLYTIGQNTIAGLTMSSQPSSIAGMPSWLVPSNILPYIVASGVFYFAVLVFVEAAWHRTLVRDEQATLMPLRLSGDEANMFRYLALLFGAVLLFNLVFIAAAYGLFTAMGPTAIAAYVPVWLVAIPICGAVAARLLPLSGLIIAQREFRLVRQLKSTARVFWGCVRGLIGLFLVSIGTAIILGALAAPILMRAMQLQMSASNGGVPASLDGWSIYAVLVDQPVTLALFILVQIVVIAINFILYGMGRGVAAYAALYIEGRPPAPSMPMEGEENEVA